MQSSLTKLAKEKQDVVEEGRIAQETLRQTNANLQRLMGEHNELRQKYTVLHQENEQLKNGMTSATTEMGRRLTDSENRGLQLTAENESLKRRLADSTNEWNNRLGSY